MLSPITSLNVVCVKTGTKYSAEMVNRLYTMVCKYLSIPFTFHCYTDDPTNINPNVRIIPFVDNGVDGVWNKLFLFSKNFGQLSGKCLFFDLDIVLLNNIDYIVHQRSFSSLCFVKSAWSADDSEYRKADPETSYILDEAAIRSNWIKLRHMIRINSSVIMWEADCNVHIWDHFMTDPEYFMAVYLGIDRFIVHEGIEHDTFPTKGICSYFYNRSDLKDMSLCLFNISKETPLEKERFEQAFAKFEEYWS